MINPAIGNDLWGVEGSVRTVSKGGRWDCGWVSAIVPQASKLQTLPPLVSPVSLLFRDVSTSIHFQYPVL
jgi:hypothetical protein